jgi:hypothetical protein
MIERPEDVSGEELGWGGGLCILDGEGVARTDRDA